MMQKYQKSYQAYTRVANEPKHMGFRFADGSAINLNMKSFVEATYTQGQPDQWVMCFLTRIVTLEGQHLDLLDEMFLNGNISQLYEFSPDQHQQPAEGEPVITHMVHRPQDEAFLNYQSRDYQTHINAVLHADTQH